MRSWMRRVATLLRIGRAARRGSGVSAGRFVVLACGTLALAVGFSVIAGSWAVYQERARHEAARQPLHALSDAEANKVRAWMAVGTDTLRDHMQFMVFSIEPVTADAPLPPGLPRWPEPGEVFVSPQLLEDGAGEQIADRYGKLAGVIGEEGLGVPDERLAWRRPPRGESLEGATGSEAFKGLEGGKGLRGGCGESDNIFTWPGYSGCVLMLLVFPASMLLYVGNGFGVEERKRRDVLLSVLGAGPVQRRWVQVGDVAGPVLAGVGFAGAALAAVIWRSPRLPVTDFVVPGDYLLLHWPVLAGVLAAAGAVTVVLSVLVPTRHRKGSTRPVRTGERSRRIHLLAFPVALFAAVRLPDVLDPGYTPGPVWNITYLIGVVATFVTLPFTLGVLVGAAGQMVAAWGRRRGSTAALIGGRRLSAAPSGTARTVAGTVILVGVLLEANVWSSLLTRFEAADRATQQSLGNSVLVTDVHGQTELPLFLDALPAGFGTFLLQESGMNGDWRKRRFVATGQCSDLRAVGFTCRGKQDLSKLPGRTRTLLSLLYVRGAAQLQVAQGTVRGTSASYAGSSALVIVDPSGKAVDLPGIKKIAYRTLASPPEIYNLGEDGFGTSTSTAHQATWIVLFGIGSVLILGTALGITAVTRFRNQADDLGSLSILTGRRTPFWGIGAWTVAAPMVLGAWVSLGVSRILIAPMT
ncbi:MAG: hypothetical protein QG608_3200, partial [Actinomycetota bacterium]|nr:hypothetical protein [Actinomycetota bacterium]